MRLQGSRNLCRVHPASARGCQGICLWNYPARNYHEGTRDSSERQCKSLEIQRRRSSFLTTLYTRSHVGF